MKANAPEKLYLSKNIYSTYLYQVPDPDDETAVEYIRADAFIEKAENFFTVTFDVEDYNDIIDVDGSPIFNYGRFIDDFKKYMEGE